MVKNVKILQNLGKADAVRLFLIVCIAGLITSCECQRKSGESTTSTTENETTPSVDELLETSFPINKYLKKESVKAALEGKDVFTLDISEGQGDEFTKDKQVTIDFVGWLENGSLFDSTLKRGAPLTFLSGANRVIIGMEQGLAGMKVGGERLLVIPPRLAYGRLGIKGRVPPESHLIYRILLRSMEN